MRVDVNWSSMRRRTGEGIASFCVLVALSRVGEGRAQSTVAPTGGDSLRCRSTPALF
jgi:hypothetical protein